MAKPLDSSQLNRHKHSSEDMPDRVLLWFVILNVGLSMFEFVAGAFSGSVALMADALHHTNDATAMLIAYVARKISRKGADRKYTFGYRRSELIGAMIQLTALIIVGLYLTYEGVMRFFNPEPVLGAWMMGASGVALVIDLGTVWLLRALSQGSLNIKAVALHNLSDAGASVAVMVGGAAVYWFGWDWVDSVLTIVISGYILYMSFGLIKRVSKILMEAVPEDIDLDKLKITAEQIEGVCEIHHIHVWEIDEQHRSLEAHIVTEDITLEYMDAIKRKLRTALMEQFEITHTTLEFEKAQALLEGEDN